MRLKSRRRRVAIGAGGMGALFAGAVIVSLTPISDGDIFWHLAAGRAIVRARALLRSDPFTLSAAGRPWIDVHWLFQLAVYAIDRVAGLGGLVVAKALAVGAGAVVLGGAVGRSGGATARALLAPALVGALFWARHLLLARPVIVTLLMLALFFAALEGLRAGRRRALLALPALQIVWTNCQGLAILGPALIAIYLVAAWVSHGADRRRWWPFEPEATLPWRPLAGALALCLLASLVTPYGLQAAALPARLFARLTPSAGNVFSVEVAENVAPFVLERVAPAQIAHLRWYLIALAAGLVLARRALFLSHLLVIAAFAVLALMANRNVLLFYWLATPIAVLAVAPRVRAALEARGRAGRLASVGGPILLLVAMAAELGVAVAAARLEPSLAEPTPFHFPIESARRLAQAGERGPTFAPDHCGGYLSFMAPGILPYIDTRLLLHSAQEYREYLTAVDSPPVFDALAERSRLRYVVLTTAYPDRYLGLAQHLAASPGWRLVFTDGSELLFARDGQSLALGEPETTAAILAGLQARFSGRAGLLAAAELNLARLLIVLDQPREALRVLSALDTRAAFQLRARAHLVEGDLAAAESLARVSLLDDPRDARSLTLLAQVAAVRRDARGAAEWLRQALEVDPYDPEARRLAATLAGDVGSGGDVVTPVRR